MAGVKRGETLMEAGKVYHMAHLNKLSLIAATFVVTTCALHSAGAAEPPADLCSLLPAAELSKTLGQAYDSPQKSIAPRPFPNTAAGTSSWRAGRKSGTLGRQ
jgi:hypothetical protein